MSTTHPPHSFKPGATWEIQGNLAYANGLPFNLGSGCSIFWEIRNTLTLGVSALELTLGSGIVVLDAVHGICLITVTPAQSALVPVGSYIDQMRATDPSGYVSDQWQGPIKVFQSFFN